MSTRHTRFLIPLAVVIALTALILPMALADPGMDRPELGATTVTLTPTATSLTLPSPTLTPTPTFTSTTAPSPTATRTQTPTITVTPTPRPCSQPYCLVFPLVMKRGYEELAPAVPVLSFSQPLRDTIRLTWSAAAQAKAYRVWRWISLDNQQIIYSGEERELVLPGLAAGTYAFSVDALNQWGVTSSQLVTIVVQPPPTFTPTPTPTATPTPTNTPVPSGPPTTLSSVADAVVIQSAPDVNAGTTYDMGIGYEECDFTSALRSLVRFDLSAVPRNAQIASAKVYLYFEQSCSIEGKSYPVYVYPANSAWAETVVTWNNQPSTGSIVSTTNIGGQDWGYHGFDVTSLVKKWASGAQPNNGIVLRSLEHSGDDTASLDFFTREFPDASYRPYLAITYVGQEALAEPAPLAIQPTVRDGGLSLRDLALAGLDRPIAPNAPHKTSERLLP